MKKTVAVLLLGGAAMCTNAEDLLCQGTSTMPDGTAADDSRVLSIDLQSFKAAMLTFAGDAMGTLRQTPQSYLGDISSRSGQRYSLTLDRYSGQVFLLRPIDGTSPKPSYKVEFRGECSRATPKF